MKYSLLKSVSLILLLMLQTVAFAADEDKWDEYIQRASEATGIEFDFIKAIIKQESGFRDDVGDGTVRSTNADGEYIGAIGAMQIMEETGADLGYSVEQLSDPETNIMAGAEYLKYLSGLSYINGDPLLMAAAYNAGPGAVKKYNGVPPYSETIPYVKNVAQNYANYSGNSINTNSLPAPTIDGGNPGIPITLNYPTVLADISDAIDIFEAYTKVSVFTIQGFFKGLLVFLMMLLVGVQILFFWKDGVSQDDDEVFADTFIFSMRALLQMSILFLLITALMEGT